MLVAAAPAERAARTAGAGQVAGPAIGWPAQAATTPAPRTPPEPSAYPTALRIPAIGVATGVVRLGLDASGALQPPDGPDIAGWFAAGPVPGDLGPALLAGHIDSRSGPAVFFRIGRLHAGDEVQVDRSDGRTVVFRVVEVATFPKDRFPTDQVYGPTPLAELRLVTCGGPFDRAAHRYLDNVIVHAVAVPG